MVPDQPAREGLRLGRAGPIDREPRLRNREDIAIRGARRKVDFSAILL
jgi:hypothetical protein